MAANILFAIPAYMVLGTMRLVSLLARHVIVPAIPLMLTPALWAATGFSAYKVMHYVLEGKPEEQTETIAFGVGGAMAASVAYTSNIPYPKVVGAAFTSLSNGLSSMFHFGSKDVPVVPGSPQLPVTPGSGSSILSTFKTFMPGATGFYTVASFVIPFLNPASQEKADKGLREFKTYKALGRDHSNQVEVYSAVPFLKKSADLYQSAKASQYLNGSLTKLEEVLNPIRAVMPSTKKIMEFSFGIKEKEGGNYRTSKLYTVISTINPNNIGIISGIASFTGLTALLAGGVLSPVLTVAGAASLALSSTAVITCLIVTKISSAVVITPIAAEYFSKAVDEMKVANAGLDQAMDRSLANNQHNLIQGLSEERKEHYLMLLKAFNRFSNVKKAEESYAKAFSMACDAMMDKDAAIAQFPADREDLKIALYKVLKGANANIVFEYDLPLPQDEAPESYLDKPKYYATKFGKFVTSFFTEKEAAQAKAEVGMSIVQEIIAEKQETIQMSKESMEHIKSNFNRLTQDTKNILKDNDDVRNLIRAFAMVDEKTRGFKQNKGNSDAFKYAFISKMRELNLDIGNAIIKDAYQNLLDNHGITNAFIAKDLAELDPPTQNKMDSIKAEVDKLIAKIQIGDDIINKNNINAEINRIKQADAQLQPKLAGLPEAVRASVIMFNRLPENEKDIDCLKACLFKAKADFPALNLERAKKIISAIKEGATMEDNEINSIITDGAKEMSDDVGAKIDKASVIAEFAEAKGIAMPNVGRGRV